MIDESESEPVRPQDSDCCGSGCKPCVFDVYEEKLKKWKAGLSKDESDLSSCLNPLKLSPFVVISLERPAHFLLHFKFQSVVLKSTESVEGFYLRNAISGTDYQLSKSRMGLKPGEYLTLRGVHEGSPISRSYTPVYREEEFESGVFTILVSLVEKGKMSEFLDSLTVGDIVYWRGPYREFEYRKNTFGLVLMIGGGTGVVPLYNISKSVVEDEEDETLLRFLCSFKTVRHFVLRRELNRLRDYWNFQLRTFVSAAEENELAPGYGESIAVGRIDTSTLSEELNKRPNDCEVLVLISGPEPFNEIMEKYLRNFDIPSNNIFIFRYILPYFFCFKTSFGPAERVL